MDCGCVEFVVEIAFAFENIICKWTSVSSSNATEVIVLIIKIKPK